jgi:hypothetical protein
MIEPGGIAGTMPSSVHCFFRQSIDDYVDQELDRYNMQMAVFNGRTSQARPQRARTKEPKKASAKARIFDFLTPTATPAGPIPPTGPWVVGAWQA